MAGCAFGSSRWRPRRNRNPRLSIRASSRYCQCSAPASWRQSAAATPGKPSWGAAIRRAGLALFAFVAAVCNDESLRVERLPQFHRSTDDRGGDVWTAPLVAQANPRWFYSRILGTAGSRIGAMVLAAGYTVWGLGTGERVSTIPPRFSVSYMWFMTQRHAQFSRWIYPLVPFVAIAGAAMLWALCDQRFKPKLVQITRGNVAVVRWWRRHGRSPLCSATVARLGTRQSHRGHSNADLGRSLVAEPHEPPAIGCSCPRGGGSISKGTALAGEPSAEPRSHSRRRNLSAPVYNDWVVVPEPDMWRTGELKRLRLAENLPGRGSSLVTGNLGYDFAVYADGPSPSFRRDCRFCTREAGSCATTTSGQRSGRLPEAGRGVPETCAEGRCIVFTYPHSAVRPRRRLEMEVGKSRRPSETAPDDAGGEAPD
jgi:hypothetical protein